MNKRTLLFVAIALTTSFTALSARAKLTVCMRELPQWQQIETGKFQTTEKGPAVIINPEASRVTWIGTGSYIRLTGEHTADGIKIMRIDGRPGVEKIVSVNQLGQITDYQLDDSLGGVGLLRVRMTGATTGKATWEHATDSAMKENLNFCTTNVLE